MHPAIHAAMAASAVSANRRRRERQEQQEKEQLKEDTEKKAMDEYCQRNTKDTYCVQEYIPSKERAKEINNSTHHTNGAFPYIGLFIIGVLCWLLFCHNDKL